MKWEKLGRIFVPDNNYSWMVSHASNPFAEEIENGVFKIYFSCRDGNNRSYIAFVVIDIRDPFTILEISDKPVLAPGEPGLFDDSGVSMGCLLKVGGKKFLYYLGWNLKVTVPWLNTIGLAIEEEENSGVFKKFSKAPIMDRSKEDPFTISYPSIIYWNGLYKMWYGSNLEWGNNPNSMKHVVKSAWSKDGIRWIRDNKVSIGFEHNGEFAISRPHVVKRYNFFYMWYSYRANGDIATYRIGYAISRDLLNWKRCDHLVGIDVSEYGWDSEMIEYPFVFTFRGTTYMLYNGNGYGKTGFGIARLVNT